MTHTKESIIALLASNDRAVVQALKTIQKSSGFNSGDHKFASSLLSQVEKWEKMAKKPYPDPLSGRQIDAARNMLARYAAVLARIANEKANPPKPAAVAVKPPVEDDDDRWHPAEDGDDYAWERAEEARRELAYMRHGYDNIEW